MPNKQAELTTKEGEVLCQVEGSLLQPKPRCSAPFLRRQALWQQIQLLTGIDREKAEQAFNQGEKGLM